MALHPCQQLIVSHAAVGNSKTDFDNFLIGVFHSDTVDLEKSQHNIDADALVSVNKYVIGNQCISETGTFLFLCGIEFLSVEAGKYRFQS